MQVGSAARSTSSSRFRYGSLTLDDGFEPGFDTVWPAPGIGDMQGGMRRVRQPLGALNHFTATAGADIVRGDRLPQDLRGDLLFAEPVGRLIRRAKIVKTDGLTQLRNAYPGSEFILGTDPLFRPVNMKTGPDGLVYITDMYHGIIQEAQWTPRGSYLRAKIEQHQLDKITSYGRVWRLRFDGLPAVPATDSSPAREAIPALQPDLTQPRMLSETPAQLVTHLTHPNGWWRDMAQRLLVLKQDKSVVPALQTMARGAPLLARFHAMWTLEGLSALDAPLVREALKDPNPRMRVQAIRLSETLYKAGDRSFAEDYRAATKDADADVAIQAMLTLNTLKVPDASADRARDHGGNQNTRRAGDREVLCWRRRQRQRRRTPVCFRSSNSRCPRAARSTRSSASSVMAPTGWARRWLERQPVRPWRRLWQDLRGCRGTGTTSSRRCCTASRVRWRAGRTRRS